MPFKNFPPKLNARMQWAPRESFGREFIKQTLVRAAANISVGLDSLLSKPSEGRFGILMYHRIVEPVPDLDRPTINVPPRQFRRQIEGLLSRGYQFWRLNDVLRLQRQGGDVPEKSVVLTFDDGFHSVFENAWPVLRDLNVPATVFLSTAFLDSAQPMPFDHWGLANRTLAPPESYRALTTEQCRILQQSGIVELGAHTHTHQDFRHRPADFSKDLKQCVGILTSDFGVERPTFAFPYGTPSKGFAAPDLVEAARNTGVVCGLTTKTERAHVDIDPFEWGRFNVFPWDDGATLSAKLSGWYGWAPKQRDQLRGLLKRLTRRPATQKKANNQVEGVATNRFAADGRQTISVIVPTFNRSCWIQDAIETLDQQQTGDQFDVEIVVVDNASSDNTEVVVRETAAKSRQTVRYLFQEKPGDAPTRNRGVAEANGEWLAFFDDDQFAEPDWLRELYRAAIEADADVVGGPVHLDLPQAELQRIGPLCRSALREISFYPTLQPYINNDLPGTGNALVHRSVFENIGKFDESMISGGSDSDFFLRAREAGYRLWYTPTAVIRHRISPNRLTAEYLKWDALSGGAGHAAHFDLLKKGKLAMLVNCLLRVAQASTIHFPRFVFARWRKDQGQALGRMTRIWRTEGYVRKTLASLAPRLLSQKEFFESLEFRKGREVGADQIKIGLSTVDRDKEPQRTGF